MTLVEYGDFECPFCGAAHGVVNAVEAAMEGPTDAASLIEAIELVLAL